MNNEPKTLVIHAHEVAKMCNISQRSAYRLLERIRKRYGREPKSMVSVEDFCAFTGFSEGRVNHFLQ